MRELTVHHPIAGDPGAVIDGIWSGTAWTDRWEPVRQFDILYDDGAHQLCRLAVEWEGAVAQMRLARFRSDPRTIDFFCPDPPHPLTFQTGTWSVKTCEGVLCLVATRRIALARASGESAADLCDRLDRHAERLAGRLSMLLPRFAAMAA